MPFYEMIVRYEDKYANSSASDKYVFEAPDDAAAMLYLRSDTMKDRYKAYPDLFGRVSRIDGFVQINEHGAIVDSQHYTNIGRENWQNERHVGEVQNR